MLYDIGTVFLKELNEIMHLRDSLRATIFAMVVPVIFMGFFISVNSGIRWVQSYDSLIVWLLSFIMVIQIIADSFAGERERHTLETLLATRLGEPAILIGKIAAAIVYGFALACTGIVLSLLTVSLTSGQGHLLMFPLPILVSGILTGILSASTAAVIGTLISLRAASARQAQQMLGFAMLLLFLMPVLLVYVLPREIVRSVLSFMNSHELSVILITVFTGIAVLDLALFAVALARFKRHKMSG